MVTSTAFRGSLEPLGRCELSCAAFGVPIQATQKHAEDTPSYVLRYYNIHWQVKPK